MTGSSNYQWLHEAIAGGCTVITSSRRLARELRQAFDERQIAEGRVAWPTADICFWQDWLGDSLDELADGDGGQLIDTAASIVLWEQCLGHTAKEDLLSTSGLVRHARRAWQRIHEWLLPLERLSDSAASRDEHWFARAAARYQARLREARWLDSAQLAEHCTALFSGGRIATPPRIIHAGFDHLTPAMSGLLDSLTAQGCEVAAAPVPQQQRARRLRSYADASAMWRAAGNWARELLNRDPDARIGIVAPDLEADAIAIARHVREGFAPGWQLAGGRYRAAVDVSYGIPLSRYPAVSIAGLCLQFASDGLSGSDVSILLRSPFLGDDDVAGRSRLDMRLRSMPDRHWQPAALLAALETDSAEGDGHDWRARAEAIASLHEQRNEERSPAAWAEAIDGLLDALGWPGISQPDSVEFQLLNRWRQLLNELARLGSVRPALKLAEAVRRLFQIASESVYQPESQAGGLRVLGMLEAIGLEFDHLWIGGLDAGRWPPAGNPLALVNRRLQRELGMPDASPADTLEFAQRILQRLEHAACEAELCWARLEDDKELIPSPLLRAREEDVLRDAGDPSRHAVTLLRAASGEISPDEAPPVLRDEDISGGAYTVQAMREDPFTAFASGRLQVRELELMQPGLTARHRGTFVHEALHHLLRDLPTQASLRGWDSASRANRIEKSAWHPLRKHYRLADPVLQRLLQLEKRRLVQLLDAFLEREFEREPFDIVGVEYDAALSFGPVNLKLRVDRLDRLEDGSLLVVDYKSGAQKPFMNRKRDAPAQLQLCVYARAIDAMVGGLALVFVNSRQIAWVGDGGPIPWGKTDAGEWPQRLEEWCREVDVLLTRFAGGDIAINTAQKIADARPLAVLSRFAEFQRVE